jgi:hypothetical protein
MGHPARTRHDRRDRRSGAPYIANPRPPYGEDLKTVGEFAVESGETVPFVLSYGPSFQDPPAPIDPLIALERTEAFWCEWSARCPDVGPWTEAVKQSLITLKALTFAPTGGIVAAATTSLPEHLGGARNWDYRYYWLRDATFTLLAFMSLGYYDEARAWRGWLTRAIAGSPRQVQIMYGVGGERWLPELVIPWLPGYEKSAPVRVGNDASQQLQLDVYGEIADTISQTLKVGMEPPERARTLRPVVLEYLATAWRQPDEGIWEVRGGPQHFVHSKVMAWVAFDRAATELATHAYHESGQRWRDIADDIHAEICERGFDRELNSFVQAYGSKCLDASLLLMPLVGFLPASDPRIQGTLRAIEDRLLIDGEFVLRYETENTADGLPPGEGAFLACSFWLVDNYIFQGRYVEARKLFDRLLARCNDVGLLAEEVDPLSGRMLGNFPQAYSHVGLINSALNLSRQTGPAEVRADRESTKGKGLRRPRRELKGALPTSRRSSPSFSSVSRGGPIKQRQLQPVDFEQAAASDALQVAVQPGRRFDDAANLLFTFRPQPHHCLAFAVKVGLHVAEPFDDGLDPVPESRAGQVLVHQLHLGLLAFTGEPRCRQRDQRLAQGDGHGDSAPRFAHPDPVDLVKRL